MKKPNIHRVLRFVVTLFGAAAGGGLAALGLNAYRVLGDLHALSTLLLVCVYVGCTIAMALIAWFYAPRLIGRVARWASAVQTALRVMPAAQILSGAGGLVLGLVIATLITQLFRVGLPDLLWAGVSAIVYLMLGYLGVVLGTRRWREVIQELPRDGLAAQKLTRADRKAIQATGKILDTSVLIDGRIFDVCRTGFVEGPLLVPQFVLEELRHIADASDPLRRARGRRGLDMVAKMQKELDIGVQVIDLDFPEVAEVDVKLLRLARQMGATVVTNDFNLNKVADLSGMKVLNINDLAGALRPVLLPGEEMRVQVLREGKEPGQGIGYLGDGTMIVVDNGRRHIGETVDVVVTTVLQTSAGRMIFTKLKQAA